MTAVDSKPKKLALALSGCAGRAIAYIGVLEVLEENGIPVSAIAACSSGSLVAVAYASGNLEQFKQRCFSLDTRQLIELFGPNFRGGIFSFDKIDGEMKKMLSADNLEDLPVPVAVVASDIISGEEVVFTMGDIIRAIKASCSVPGLFEPVVWGSKVLIDGGLFNVVPVEIARQFGCDVIIGLRAKDATHHIFHKHLLDLRVGYNFIKMPFVKFFRLAGKLKHYVLERPGIPSWKNTSHIWTADQIQEQEVIIDQSHTPSMFDIMIKAMDYAVEQRKKDEVFDCDLMIDIDTDIYGRVDTENFKNIYSIGRQVAQEKLPKIKELMAK